MLFSETLAYGNSLRRPDKGSQKFAVESRKHVPIEKSRYVLSRRFCGANLRRALERGQLALGRMHSGGCLVYVASSMSPEPSLAGGIEYEVIRAGLERVVTVLAREGAEKGVRVNALMCLVDHHELKTERLEEIAGTVVFLASDEAKNMSGETLALDGTLDRG